MLNRARTRTIEIDGTRRPGYGDSMLVSLAFFIGLRLSVIVPALGFVVWVADRGAESAVRAEDAENIDLDEIARRVKQWRDSFVNLRVEWEVRTLPETDEDVVEWPEPPDTAAIPPFIRTEWIWADHGLDRLEDQRNVEDEKGKMHIGPHTIEAFDGPNGRAFRALFDTPPEEGPERLVQLDLLGIGVGKPTSSFTRLPLEGAYWPGTAQWLPEILAEWKWKLQGIENVAGEPCARLVADQPYQTDVVFTETIWLDLSRDCLVRRNHSEARKGRGATRDFIVDEFQRLEGTFGSRKAAVFRWGALVGVARAFQM